MLEEMHAALQIPQKNTLIRGNGNSTYSTFIDPMDQYSVRRLLNAIYIVSSKQRTKMTAEYL